MSSASQQVMSALAEPRRRQIVELVASNGRMSATAISSRFDITPAAISQHLKVLRDARVLRMTKRAQQRLYQINPEAFDELEQWSKRMREAWATRFDQLDELLARDESQGGV